MGATVTATGAVTVMVATLNFVVSAAEVAVRVTPVGLGWLEGAVYVMGVPDALEVAESEPQAAPVQPAPDRAQVTPLFCESFCTVAVKFCVPIPA